MLVLIAPDKFKGTLNAPEVAAAIARGWKAARPQDRLELLPISDGGDGFGQVMGRLRQARTRQVRTVDAAGRPIRARWWWNAAQKAAIIESAEVIGLAKLPPGRFHPFQLDTTGLAAVIHAASRARAEKCFIGIGGSATNDAGFGIAKAMGWQFLDGAGKPIEVWTDLTNLRSIEPPKEKIRFREIVVAVDVQNRLLGKHGATRIYGPQKGLRSSDFAKAEAAIERLARVARKRFGWDYGLFLGAGAAGGLGFGLAAFLGARLQSGFELFAREARLKREVDTADLVITGEGRIDQSTVMGKGVGELAKMCNRAGVPCLGLAGKADFSNKPNLFARVGALSSMVTLKRAQSRPAYWLEKLAKSVAAEL
jgi:glycerate kinase